MFYGENLKNLRMLYGVSRKELANKLKLTEQSIGNYENESFSPEINTVIEMSKIFDVKSTFFFKKFPRNGIVPTQHVAFRSSERNIRKSVAQNVTQINFAANIIEYCEAAINFKANKLKSLVHQLNTTKKKALLSGKGWTIEDTAKYTRNSLKIDSNKRLLYIVENAGAFVIEKEIDINADAYSVWTRNEDGSLRSPFIILGRRNKSAVRRIFDVAHELGHLLMHTNVDFENLENSEFREYEHEANEFASALLLPQEKIKEAFKTVRNPARPDDYKLIKKDFLVSLATAEYRAYKLGLVSKEQNNRFFASMYRKHYKQIEPLDNDIPINRPEKIKALLKLLYERGDLGSIISDVFQIEPKLLIEVLGLSDSFLGTITDSSCSQNNVFRFA